MSTQQNPFNPESSVYVSGHNGMVGSSVCRALERYNYSNLLCATRSELDLTYQSGVFDFFAQHRPQCQIICAATVGGIWANSRYPGNFIGQNLMIQTNLIEAARRFNCQRTVFVASSCIYPRQAPQPMKEDYLLTGSMEPTNRWYAIAKLAGITMAQAYRQQFGLDIISVLPTNLYGPGDSFNLEHAHVLPSLMRKFHEAKESAAPSAVVWGSGQPRREFMHVDDLADALLFLLAQDSWQYDVLNIGSGQELTIAELTETLKRVIGFAGELIYDSDKPDGAPRKWLDSSRINDMGWHPSIDLEDGIRSTYQWFLSHAGNLREVDPARIPASQTGT